MKKILSFLGVIGLTATSTTSLVACNKTHEYTPEELAQLKQENKINTTNKNIKDNLEWIAAQEKPFNSQGDYKYYIIVWKGAKKDNWTIKKYKNIGYTENNTINGIISYTKIDKSYSGAFLYRNEFDLAANKTREYATWIEDDGTFFKAVYRWNLDTKEPDLIIDDNGNIKVNGE
ncbi:putative lipoprotein [Spiroplasma kunkelii CR2-3x]|uniref:Putative lipoprotein n=1 Tax=Spiroplasma kunkelii CR2-3x TaxID=273035 RepID=A0A0K2JH35_SPIKU|nr:lipoprotein [Spiroplasma kunkelii]ALA97899.1 putative lipoprotein [Spiroplasma kunkelii CR2-3x]